MSDRSFEYPIEFVFPGFPGDPRVTVLFRGTYEPGCPARGFSGPPENYDPGEPPYVLLTGASVDGEPVTVHEFEERMRSLLGPVTDGLLDAACEELVARYYREHPDPPEPEDCFDY